MPPVRCIPLRRCAAVFAGALLAAAVLGGCAAQPQLSTVVDKQGAYTSAEVEQMANATSLGAASSLTKQQAPAERQRALAALRRSGAEGVAVADLLTKLFPADTAAVPVSIEHARVDGNDALVVVEAAAGRDGKLTTRRVWVLSYPGGAIIDSASFR